MASTIICCAGRGGEDLGDGALRGFGRSRAGAGFPIGIESATVAAQAEAADEARHMPRLRQSLGTRADDRRRPARLFERACRTLPAYSHLLEALSRDARPNLLLQIAPPSRGEVPEYQRDPRDWKPPPATSTAATANPTGRRCATSTAASAIRILTGFYRAARIGLVTPLRDGMNLVAKEYVAAQDPDDPGVLVLSRFAGAARELGEALIVNPYDIEAWPRPSCRAEHAAGRTQGALARDDDDARAQRHNRVAREFCARPVGDRRAAVTETDPRPRPGWWRYRRDPRPLWLGFAGRKDCCTRVLCLTRTTRR